MLEVFGTSACLGEEYLYTVPQPCLHSVFCKEVVSLYAFRNIIRHVFVLYLLSLEASLFEIAIATSTTLFVLLPLLAQYLETAKWPPAAALHRHCCLFVIKGYPKITFHRYFLIISKINCCLSVYHIQHWQFS